MALQFVMYTIIGSLNNQTKKNQNRLAEWRCMSAPNAPFIFIRINFNILVYKFLKGLLNAFLTPVRPSTQY